MKKEGLNGHRETSTENGLCPCLSSIHDKVRVKDSWISIQVSLSMLLESISLNEIPVETNLYPQRTP